MPHMVNSDGFPIYAAQSSGGTLVTPLNADTGISASSLVVASAGAATSTFGSTVPQMTPSGRSQEDIVKDQQAIQAGLDNATPRNLLLIFGGFLVLLIILVQPRFLARLFASTHRQRRSAPSNAAYAFDMPPHSATPLQSRPEKPVGGGDLRQGWILRSGKDKSIDENACDKSDHYAFPFDEPDSFASKAPTMSPPPHITPLLSHLPFSLKLLYAPLSRLPQPFTSPVDLTQLYLILGYLIINGFALVWRSDVTPTTEIKGYGNDFMRTGLVAMAHLPIVIALGVRGNLIGLCIGRGYEKLKTFHKITGRMLFLAATLHVAFYFQKFASKGTLGKMLTKPFILAGFIAWICIVVIAISSIPYFRNAFYGIFKICHVLGTIGLLGGMCWHVDVAVPWCVAAMCIYLLSIICSITKTRIAHAEISALPGSNTTLITIPALRTGWRAGQHVRIRVPGLGLAYGLHGHPFTIASAPDGEGMVLMCKVAGDWTRRLYEFAEGAVASDGRNEKVQSRSLTATVILEGPYGGLGNTLLPSFSGVMLVAGGSGITHAVALAHDLITRAPSGVVRARTIDLIWSVRTEEAARPLVPTLLDMLDDARKFETRCIEGRKRGRDLPTPVALRIHIYITRFPVSSPITLLGSPTTPTNLFSSEHDDILEDRRGLKRQPSSAEREKADYLARTKVSTVAVQSPISPTSPSGESSTLSAITVEKRRPDFGLVLDEIVDQVMDRSRRGRTNPCGVCVVACGPNGMIDGVRDAARNLEGWKRRAVGNVELEEQRFGF